MRAPRLDSPDTMNRRRQTKRRPLVVCCSVERLEGRRLLSGNHLVSPLLGNPIGYLATHPNTPVMPFATPAKKASYIDPSVTIVNPTTVVVGYQSFIGPYATLDGSGGAIKIGNGSDVLDNASIIAHKGAHGGPTEVLIGDSVVIGFGAKVIGPSTIGAYGSAGAPTSIGANAVIDGAAIEPGAIVSPLARVGPGVTVPSGYRVLPGAQVTTDEEASNPALKMVVRVTASDLSTVQKTLAENESLAAGYVTLYQGSSTTGASEAVSSSVSGVYNGNLAAILGANQEPGPSSASFEPAKSSPEFLSPHMGLVPIIQTAFPARLSGFVEIKMRMWTAAFRMGRANSIRADQGQPIVIDTIAHTGPKVTINSPLGGQLTIGENFRAGKGAVILGGPNYAATIGDNVSIGAGAVVDRTSLGSNSSVGAGAYLFESTFAANTVIPAGAIYMNNKLEGYVER
jgi:carbonic anhydrase/acetyltransferase-like protein (isoleucine patch superfamily)